MSGQPGQAPTTERITVHIVDTGVANLASILAGIRRVGGIPLLSRDAVEIEYAPALVLPGVGAFAAGMKRLRSLGLADPLVRRFAEKRPTLAICLGLQLLCEESEESPNEPGLGIIPASITRFPDNVRVPQLGWNHVRPHDREALIATEGYAYFANSYRLELPPPQWDYALSHYSGPFVAAVQQGPLLACQFHPELSGTFGQTIIQRWITTAVSTTR